MRRSKGVMAERVPRPFAHPSFGFVHPNQCERLGPDCSSPSMPVKAVASEVGRSMPQVALAWLRYREVPRNPIIGARKVVAVAGQPGEFGFAAVRGASEEVE